MVQLETHILRMITNNTVEWNINASEVSWNQGGFYYAKKQAENMESYQLLFLLLKQCEKY